LSKVQEIRQAKEVGVCAKGSSPHSFPKEASLSRDDRNGGSQAFEKREPRIRERLPPLKERCRGVPPPPQPPPNPPPHKNRKDEPTARVEL